MLDTIAEAKNAAREKEKQWERIQVATEAEINRQMYGSKRVMSQKREEHKRSLSKAREAIDQQSKARTRA